MAKQRGGFDSTPNTRGHQLLNTGNVWVPGYAATANLQIEVIGHASGGSATVYVDMAELDYDEANLLLNQERSG